MSKQPPDPISRALMRSRSPESRRLQAQAHTRSIFQSRRVPPEAQPAFTPNLVQRTYQQAYDYLRVGMEYLSEETATSVTDELFQTAGELLEKLYFNAPVEYHGRERELYTAALCYYLSGHYARSYVLMQGTRVSQVPRPFAILRMLYAKEFDQMRRETLELLLQPDHSDQGIAQALQEGTVDEGDAIERILQATLNRSFSLLVGHLEQGQAELLDGALRLIANGMRLAIDRQMQEWWWIFRSALAMLREYRGNSLWTQLKPMLDEDGTGMARAYVQGLVKRARPVIELWRSQRVAVPCINEVSRPSFCVKMPTGTGKTRIAELAILRFILDSASDPSRKCLYIAPYRALALEVESTLRESFAPLGVRVSQFYGGFDLSPFESALLGETRVLIATPEKADAILRYSPDLAKSIGLIIVDEGHIIDRSERGLRYEMFLHRLVRRFADRGIRVVFVSAVMPGEGQFTDWITNRPKEEGLVATNWRASTLYLGILKWDGQSGWVDYIYHGPTRIEGPHFMPRFVTALPSDMLRRAHANRYKFPSKGSKKEIIALAGIEAAQEGATLIYVPQPDWVESTAEAILTALSLREQLMLSLWDVAKPKSLPLPSTPQDIARWKSCIQFAEGATGAKSVVARALRKGLIVHHGRMPKALRAELELLARDGIVQLIVATSTLAHGVNLPVRTILIHSLVRGEDDFVPATEFWNICGRAGRAFCENEGQVLLLADETDPRKGKTAKKRAQGTLTRYVFQAQSEVLASAMRLFLESVLARWKELHPDASLPQLCQRLADNEIDWLSPDDLRLLPEFDTQLLALLEEASASSAEPCAVQELFERSLLFLQVAPPKPDTPLTMQTAVDLLTARVAYILRIPASSRQRFYRAGMAISGCQYIEEHREEIRNKLASAKSYLDWDAERRCDYIVALCQEVLTNMPGARPNEVAECPVCWPTIVKHWLLGSTAEQIARIAAVAAEVTDAMRISCIIDELCDFRLPWGANALCAYLTTTEDELDSAWGLPDVIPYLAPMIRHGVHSPVAVMLMAAGCESRQAALICADRYSGPLDSALIFGWLNGLPDQAIDTWGLDKVDREHILALREKYQAPEPRQLDADLHLVQLPDRAYVSPLIPGMKLIGQIVPPSQITLYTPAVEHLGTVQVSANVYHKMAKDQVMIALHGLEKAADGTMQASVLLWF